jgi:ABC-2 type transport system permease protein
MTELVAPQAQTPTQTSAGRSFLLLVRWEALRVRQFLPLLLVIQVALGVGVIYGFAFLVPHITPTIALYFATGAPTLTLILMGLSILPQETSQARTSGRFAYITALPVPRLVPMLASVTFWLLVQLPGAVVTLLIATVRFDLHLHVSLLVVPAVVLVSMTAATVGYAIAVVLPPTVASQVASFASIVLLLFSPINFPLDRLPMWLQDVHRGLPVTYSADIVRGSLGGGYGTSRALAYGVVLAWCALGLLLAGRAANRRG